MGRGGSKRSQAWDTEVVFKHRRKILLTQLSGKFKGLHCFSAD